MGMFDELRVEHILPGKTEITDEWYQTKDLECVMTKYVISANGELYEEKWEWEWVEENTHWLGGYMEKIEGSYHREYLTDYHGDVRFYSGTKPETGKWRDYYARFTNGKLSKMWYKDSDY
jgi:hypothetical protein